MKAPVLSTNEELVQKAIDRAKSSLATQEADFAVGFAEGALFINGTAFSVAWCAVISKLGATGIGGGFYIQLPKNLSEKFISNKLLEEDVEKFLEGYLIKDMNPFEVLVQQALSNFKNS